ncbi:ribonuclease R [Beggiatoa leptomitoformis]|uniref:Ribonuclease R n=1 Tax=Beggiatoa leptomitoformis TaxID=288004 RepID=A0A2N9YF45_9GAMM|nr:ribonuclease R [Beggiatoa leptomitoformis]ALG68558.1 ribonuclease R [Beggiatoa leptomitoformis]AUI69097.1 ribonuclease R [Beggiatoa leptomitoformis]
MQRRKKKNPRRTADIPKADPYAEREQQKYQDPIASREFIMAHLAEAGQPLNFQAIAERLKLNNDEVKLDALSRRLRAMERDGQIIRNRREGYGLAKKMDLICGRVSANADGAGFLIPDTGGEDLFLPPKQMRTLFHGDRAMVSIGGLNHRGKREGILVEVLERNTQEIVGHFFRQKGLAFVTSKNRRITHDILIPPADENNAEEGQIVVVKIIEQPSKHHPPIGQIVDIIGKNEAPGMETDIAIRSYSLPYEWSDDVLSEIKHLKEKIPASAIKDREDLRDIPLVTIDGEDAKDFDDAVYCEPRGKGWRLLVAIADVASYVKPNTALDMEAQARGNSVYFPNRVVPMLPEILSNGLCSLKPHVDRLCMVCELFIDVYGRTRRIRFFEGVMRSQARLTYTEVGNVLAGENTQFRYPELLPHIQHLHKLYQLLLTRRQKRGAIEFETVETKILFDDNKKIEKIVAITRNDAHRLIEEMMLAANVATAEWLEKHEMPALYRNHEGPTPDKLKDLHSFLGGLGLRLGGKEIPTALDYAKLMEKIKDRPDVRLIQTVLLRSLRMAVYSPENKGHFGLAYTGYTHFTSPIRRYPDLLVHRALKHLIKKQDPKKFFYNQGELERLGEVCSMTERRADEATRDVVSWLKCEYMRNKVGDNYEGLVTAVTSFGLFVELEGVYVEGLVHVTALRNDYYHYDPAGQCLRGERTGTIYRLSDRLKVKVMRVDLGDRKIDFELAN